jgi:hypothetical protein
MKEEFKVQAEQHTHVIPAIMDAEMRGPHLKANSGKNVT